MISPAGDKLSGNNVSVHNCNFVIIRAIYGCIISPPICSWSQHVIDAYMPIFESAECPLFICYIL